MGRNKIKIEKIKNEKLRQITLLKRKRGVLKKAMELSLLCEAKVLLIIYDDFEKKSIFYSSEEDYRSFANDYFDKKVTAENYANLDYNTQFYKEAAETTKSHKSESSRSKNTETVRKESLYFNPEVLIDDKSEKDSVTEVKNFSENVCVFKNEDNIKPQKLLSNKRVANDNNNTLFESQFPAGNPSFPLNNFPNVYDKLNSTLYNSFASPNSNFIQRNSIYQNELNKILLQNYMNMYMLSNKF